MLAGIPICIAMIRYPLYGLAHSGEPSILETLALSVGASILVLLAAFLRSTRPGLSDFQAVALGMLAGCAGTFGVIAGYIFAAMMFF